ncbi:MAG: 50S ribosomal protein L11 methyltransferase [Nonlabens sp.]
MTTTDQLYIEYIFTIKPLEPWRDVLIAQLGELGFESFMHTPEGFKAYVLQSMDSSIDISTMDLYDDVVDIAFAKAEVPPTNWNAEWEKNFDPIQVEGLCEVRAPFHSSQGLKYDIVIEPKMSFGTGHHQTTHMMIQHLLKEDIAHKSVLDMGCGTGVLAILASMKNAQQVDAIDIDTWCFENSSENVERNQIDNIQVILGDVEVLGNKKYDLIIANINRNVLLADIPKYSSSLVDGGVLLLSGFYEDDLSSINETCKVNEIAYDLHMVRERWASSRMIKKSI